MERKRDKTVVGIATIEDRKESLFETLRSLVNNVDIIMVYQNDYTDEDVPARLYKQYDDLDIEIKTQIYFVHGKNTYGDIGDVGKFYPVFAKSSWMLPKSYYMFVCDDDLIYPPDYVEKTVESLKFIDNECIVGYHGKCYFEPVDSYYRSLQEDIDCGVAMNYRCLDQEDHSALVTIIGTGCTAWHSSLFANEPLSLAVDFPHKNMADILFSAKCNGLGISRFVLKHDAGWIRHSENVDMDRTIFRTHYNDDELQTQVFNSVNWKL